MAPFRTSLQRLVHAITTNRRWLVIGMLLALHAAMISERGSVLQRLLLLSHFGFFLVWQPFFAAERELKIFSVILLLAITGATLYFLPAWLMVLWMLVLLGILGGRVFMAQAEDRNRFYLVAFMYVLTLLLLWVVPELLLGERELPPVVGRFAREFLPLVLVLLVFLPRPTEEHVTQVFDFFYALLVFQLGMMIVLGSIVVMRFTGAPYVNAVIITLFGTALALFMFAALWNPMRGFGGLRTYFSVYLMSVGLPFELWMRRMAELAETESDARRFLELSLQEMSGFAWMRGATWKSPEGEGRFGEQTEYVSRFSYHSLELAFFTKMLLSPALLLHMRLLAQVVGEFYEGKRREAMLRRNAYLQAVHETGARLTHDVKNLLQSLYTLTSMAPKDESDEYAALLQRQLPQLTKRLQATLEKLRSPEGAASDLPVLATAWWSEVERRLSGSDVSLDGRISADASIPAALFDSFIENTIDNARAKRAADPSVRISIRFVCDAASSEISVCDTGKAVPETMAQRLFREPIERGGGLGIGLYHLARLAQDAGYRMVLVRNMDGRV
ncbi:MAG TPA: ATP-binding protein, partial [Usitatibacter sp.]|nr:ATP-binding protein [Usitatibacter sp.]